MGNNVDLTDLLGLPEIIECPHCGAKVQSYFHDHDIECSTTYEKGHWTLRMYCDSCEKDFKYEFKIEIKVLKKQEISMEQVIEIPVDYLRQLLVNCIVMYDGTKPSKEIVDELVLEAVTKYKKPD